MSEARLVGEAVWEIPAQARPDMRVPARVFADEELFAAIERDTSLEQIQNVATLPGIVDAALAMPDVHQATVFRSAAWRRWSFPTASSPRAGSGTTSTAACGCSRSR
jgi:hypothetical protein